MAKTARQYGEEMRFLNLKFPAPVIGPIDMVQPGVSIYKIGGRSVRLVFVFVRHGWGTVYVQKDYSGYRDAFDAVMPRDSFGRDVDHLFPKSRASAHEFVALGRITVLSNRGWKDDDSIHAMVQKVRDASTLNPHGFTSFLTDMERGWAAVTCYIRPIFEMEVSALKLISRRDLAEAK